MVPEIYLDPAKTSTLMRELENVADNISKQAGIVAWKTAKKTKSYIAKQLSREINTKQTVIKKQIVERRLNRGGHVQPSLLVFQRKMLPLKRFKPRQKKLGVSARVLKKGKLVTIPGGFMGPTPKKLAPRLRGHAFKRVGKSRLPIRKLTGMIPVAYYIKRGKIPPTINEINSILRQELRERVRYLTLKKAGQI